MGHFFIDESIHDRGDAIVAGVVYFREDPNDVVERALLKHGFSPGEDEFKSGARMSGRPDVAHLREELRQIVHGDAQIGTVVGSSKERSTFGIHVLRGVEHIIAENNLRTGPHRIFIDQGIVRESPTIKSYIRKSPTLRSAEISLHADSRRVLGVQLADLIAHTAATMLLAELGVVRKTVKAGENSGYDPDWDLELEFALWAGVRYSFFRRKHTERASDDPLLDGSPGLYIAGNCGEAVRVAAEKVFGDVYLGCLH